MTGAAGHVPHLHENLDLQFKELKEILSLACNGNLEHVTEKVDGINLMFSYDIDNGLRVARSGNDIKIGGLGAIDLSEKFADKGNIRHAFNEGFEILSKAVSAIPDYEKSRIFGRKTNRWYSVEIIYTPISNTINYDSNHLVFHESPMFEFSNGLIVKSLNDELGKVLNFYVNQMQAAVTLRNWQVSGPAVVTMKQLSDGSMFTKFINEIDDAMTVANVNDSNTIRDYIYGMAVNELTKFNLTREITSQIADRIAKKPNSKNLIALKKMLNINERDSIDAFVKNEIELKRKWMRPIEHSIQKLSIEILKGLQSPFICNPDKEVKRLRDRLSKAINAIRTSGDADAMNVLNVQMQKLGDIENIASALEGIVFMYKGTTYKFTGAFAPLHQILSLFTFGSMKGFDLDIENYSRS